MFRIRKVTDAHAPANRTAVAQAQAILRARFSTMDAAGIDALPDQLADPFARRFVTTLMVAEDARAEVRAVAVILHDPELAFAFLDMLAASAGAKVISGTDGALYERVRQEAAELGAEGLYFEGLPDAPELSPDPALPKQNIDRLKFYERLGARPITGTAYETPLGSGDSDPPLLVFDGLGRHALPGADRLRAIVRAILERRYGDLCPPEYIATVLASIREGGYPTVIVQEGGYAVRTLGASARAFFEGYASGLRQPQIPLRSRTPAALARRVWRSAVQPGDPAAIRALVDATGKFSGDEIAIAEELPRERLAQGKASGYEFVLVSEGGRLLGYTCFGQIPGSEVSWDLYWIAVAPEAQGNGLGGELLRRSEAAIRRAGGRQVFIETSSTPAYAPTRGFYLRQGYAVAAELADFYRSGDGKVIYSRRLPD